MTESTKDIESWICFHFLLNKLGAYAINSQSLTFETDYIQKVQFYAVCWHKQRPDNQTKIKCQSLSESYEQHNFFGTKFRGGQHFSFTLEGFLNKREYSGADCVDLLLSPPLPQPPKLINPAAQSKLFNRAPTKWQKNDYDKHI